jgi:hypothetical protein
MTLTPRTHHGFLGFFLCFIKFWHPGRASQGKQIHRNSKRLTSNMSFIYTEQPIQTPYPHHHLYLTLTPQANILPTPNQTRARQQTTETTSMAQTPNIKSTILILLKLAYPTWSIPSHRCPTEGSGPGFLLTPSASLLTWVLPPCGRAWHGMTSFLELWIISSFSRQLSLCLSSYHSWLKQNPRYIFKSWSTRI